MKKFTILATAFALAASAANAESVTISHETAGALEAELKAAIAASEALTAMADITELTITGEAVMDANDFVAIRANLRPSLVTLDMSQAKFASNALPGGFYDKEGILNKMNIVECKLPETLTSLSGGVFFECKKLERVNLPDGIRSIPQYCFSGCEKLNMEALPPQLTTVYADAFNLCKALTVAVLPETVHTINGSAFNESGVTFSKLPSALKGPLGERAFRQAKNVTFDEIPEGVTVLKTSCFAGTQVTFKTFPKSLTGIETCVLQSCKQITEFTIPNIGTLWTKIPDGTFYVNEAVTRTFICRAPSAPVPTKVTGNNWDESFGRPEMCVNTTMKVLYSAMESFQSTAPYNKMKIEALKTAVEAPIIDMPAGHDAANVKVAFVVNGVEHTSFDEVLEGEGKLVVSFDDAAHAWLHVQEIRYAGAEAYAEGDETEEVDPDLLYAVGNVSQSLRKTVEVPVTVSPDMKPIHITVAMADVITGVEAVDAPETAISRNGDIVNLTVPGAALYDLAGRMVVSTDSNVLDLGGVPAGGYILRAGKKAVKIIK